MIYGRIVGKQDKLLSGSIYFHVFTVYLTTLSAYNDRMSSLYWIGNDVQGSGRSLVEILSRYLPVESERDQE